MSVVQPIDAKAASSTSARRSLGIIFLAAVFLLAPELVVGLTVSDSFRFNLLWPEQFSELFRSGHLYPRWLPRSWDGFGSPVFYFYPPLFFWVTALVDTLTMGLLPPGRIVPLGSLVLLAASGVAMRAWLKTRVGEYPALAGAIAYLVAPYHLYDIYGRGALAEASAYASLPVVMLALARLSENRTRYLPLLSLAYAALLLSHLPSALLVSLFMIPPYVLFVARRAVFPVRFIALALAGGAIGIAVAAAYLVPALALLRYVSPDALSGSFYRPENWFFWHFPAGPFGARMLLIIPAALAAGLLAAGTAFALRSVAGRQEALYWAVLTIILVVLIAGGIPPVWKLPGLSLVQFPWRALLLVEFATVTALTISAPSIRNPLIIGGTALLAFAYAVLGLMAAHTIARTYVGGARSSAEIRTRYLDAPEYLPAGNALMQGEAPDNLHIWLPGVPIAQAAEPEAKVQVSPQADGGMIIVIDTPEPTHLVLRRFEFPHWKLVDGKGAAVAIEPTPRERLVSFRTPAGHSFFRLTIGVPPYEMIGVALTILALLSLAMIAAMTSRTGAPELARPRTSSGRSPSRPNNRAGLPGL